MPRSLPVPLAGALAASALVLAACGDDTSADAPSEIIEQPAKTTEEAP
ncbi:hypothetical protein ACNI3K_08290 [Demequina sp. SO4-13]